MELRKRYVGLVLAAVLALSAVAFFAWRVSSPYTAQATDPNIPQTISLGATGTGLACDEADQPTECTVFDPTGAFVITVNADVIPEGGYSGIGSEIVLGDLTHNQRENCNDELVWPDRTFCTRFIGLADQVQHAGAVNLIPPFDKSNFTGTLVEVDVQCPGEGEYEVLLTAWEDQAFGSSFGATYVGLDGVSTQVKPVEARTLDLDGDGEPDTRNRDTDGDTVPDTVEVVEYDLADTLAITCGGEIEAVPGDANGNGSVNSLDALLILQLDAGLISSVPSPENADANGDGSVNSLDALLILQFDAGLIGSL